jgi:hypothetical protein
MQINVSFDSIEEMLSFAKLFNQPATVVTAPTPVVVPQPLPDNVTVTPMPVTPVVFAVREPVVEITPSPVTPATPAQEKPAFTLPATEPQGEKKKRGRPRKMSETEPPVQQIQANESYYDDEVPSFDEDEGASPGTDDDAAVTAAPTKKLSFEFEEELPPKAAPVVREEPPARTVSGRSFNMDQQIYETPKIGTAMEDAIGYLKGQGADIDETVTFILENASKFKAFPKTSPGEGTIRKFVVSKF